MVGYVPISIYIRVSFLSVSQFTWRSTVLDGMYSAGKMYLFALILAKLFARELPKKVGSTDLRIIGVVELSLPVIFFIFRAFVDVRVNNDASLAEAPPNGAGAVPG